MRSQRRERARLVHDFLVQRADEGVVQQVLRHAQGARQRRGWARVWAQVALRNACTCGRGAPRCRAGRRSRASSCSPAARRGQASARCDAVQHARAGWKRACSRRAVRSASVSSGASGAAPAVAKDSSEGKDGSARRDAAPPAAGAASEPFPAPASSGDPSASPLGGEYAPEFTARPGEAAGGDSGSFSCERRSSERLLGTAPARGELMPPSLRVSADGRSSAGTDTRRTGCCGLCGSPGATGGATEATGATCSAIARSRAAAACWGDGPRPRACQRRRSAAHLTGAPLPPTGRSLLSYSALYGTRLQQAAALLACLRRCGTPASSAEPCACARRCAALALEAGDRLPGGRPRAGRAAAASAA